jgi:hypothetical protein
VVMLQLRGVPLLSAEKVKIELEDAGSIAQYGRQTWKPANRYIRSRVHAETLAEHVLDRFKAPPLTIRLRGVPCVPFLEPGNRVTVTETLGGTGINEPFFITKLTWTWGNSFEMTLDLVRAADLYPYSDYFVIGTSKYGDPTHPNPNALAGRLAW